MAQLYFYMGTMNAGKSTALLQSAYNYIERGMRPLILKPRIDNREGVIPEVRSRIGLSGDAVLISDHDNLYGIVAMDIRTNGQLACVFVDEAQFLTREQVHQLTDICDNMNIPVLAYGLRVDFQGRLFPGSAELLAQAEKFVEIKTICDCGRKATHVVRLDEKGTVVTDGAQVVIGGNDAYVSKCRSCFKRAVGGLR